MMVGMSQQIRMVLATLLFGILLSPTAGLAQDETLHQRFNTVLAQHGIVGGGIAIVHGQQRATEFFFGVMHNGTRQRVDSKTSYNWASSCRIRPCAAGCGKARSCWSRYMSVRKRLSFPPRLSGPMTRR